MAFHIVTKKCFLACEKVTSVIIEEMVPDRPKPMRRRKKKKGSKMLLTAKSKPVAVQPKQFTITIAYYPLNSNNKNGNFGNGSGSSEEYTLQMHIFGKKEANMLYAEIIREVQEQHPGEGYLDKLVNKMLAGEDFQVGEPKIDDER